jgi:hypothetical protein
MSFVQRYDGAGRSGMRRFRRLARDWRRRTFGARTSIYFWAIYGVLLAFAIGWQPMRSRFWVGFIFGMVAIAFYLMPDALMPDYIARWQRGAWGEQNTAKALRPLKKEGWLIRHDLAAKYGQGNRDHILVGPTVYLLDTKLLKDEVWLEGDVLHVRRVDESGDEYEVATLTSKAAKAAYWLERDLDAAVGFPVAVYPVVVIWGHFKAQVQYAGKVAYVDGDHLAEWLRSRPVDIRDERKRQAVGEWLRSIPRA